ncbi:MAG: hypothetical protein C4297_11035 [Gemmataceae bacterium]
MCGSAKRLAEMGRVHGVRRILRWTGIGSGISHDQRENRGHGTGKTGLSSLRSIRWRRLEPIHEQTD